VSYLRRESSKNHHHQPIKVRTIQTKEPVERSSHIEEPIKKQPMNHQKWEKCNQKNQKRREMQSIRRTKRMRGAINHKNQKGRSAMQSIRKIKRGRSSMQSIRRTKNQKGEKCNAINQKDQKGKKCNQSDESIEGEMQSIRRIKRGEETKL